jgi:hypothetical protein
VRHRRRAWSTDQSMTSAFTTPHHPLTRRGFARAARVKVPKNIAGTRLCSWGSGGSPHPKSIVRSVGALRMQAEIRQYGLDEAFNRVSSARECRVTLLSRARSRSKGSARRRSLCRSSPLSLSCHASWYSSPNRDTRAPFSSRRAAASSSSRTGHLEPLAT